MTREERQTLLEASVPVDANDPRSRRFAVRRGPTGLLEIFDIKFTRDVDDDHEFHGHPASRIDRRVLKHLREAGLVTDAEYNRLRKDLPGC